MYTKAQLKEFVSMGYEAVGTGCFSLALITKFKAIGYNYDATFYKHGLSREDYIDTLIDTNYVEDNCADNREFANVIINLLNHYVDSADAVCPVK